MPGDPRVCRRQALECMRLAQDSSKPEDRTDFLDLANTWLELAALFESDDARIEACGENVVTFNRSKRERAVRDCGIKPRHWN